MARRKQEIRSEDADVQAVLDVLGGYTASHSRAKLAAYRQNSASIRIRIIDPDFAASDRAIRHDVIWELLKQLDEDIQSQITVLLLLTPEETKKSIGNLDFENPVPSRL